MIPFSYKTFRSPFYIKFYFTRLIFWPWNWKLYWNNSFQCCVRVLRKTTNSCFICRFISWAGIKIVINQLNWSVRRHYAYITCSINTISLWGVSVLVSYSSFFFFILIILNFLFNKHSSWHYKYALVESFCMRWW